ncbi:MAG: imidazole glycerol phosphate synthase subunit HisF [Chitinophaga sp.]|jgi:imidazole glycerol-phosphate synthase subunit HisF|nr:imidazole glycerol phosphate synthase subunit HisF [Chitinophaga sp.]
MLKKRLIPVLYIKNGLIVRSEGFNYHQNIGNIVNEAKRYNEWNVDELVYIDISIEKKYDLRRDDHKIKSYSTIGEIITKIAEVCFMPLTFGGGIRILSDVDERIKNGADKVTINTAAFQNQSLITDISKKYGAQCVVVSIDYRMIDNKPIVFINNGTENTQMKVNDWVKICEDLGAGEIFLNSIDRDGKGKGFDIETIKNCCENTRLPVIACGGAGSDYDFLELAEETKASAFAAGNIFHFTELSYSRIKKLLKKNLIDVR